MLSTQTSNQVWKIEKEPPTKQQPIDWWSVLLVWALLLTVTRRLLVTEWTEDLHLISSTVNIAFLAGLALGYSKFKRRTIALFSLAYGCFFIGWRLGLLQNSEVLWTEKVSLIFVRLSVTFQRIANRQPVYDNLFFILLMMILFWWLGINTSLSLVRYASVFRIIAPMFLVIITIHTYDPLIPSRNNYLFLFSVLSIFLISRIFLISHNKDWSEKRFYIPPQLSSDMVQFTAGFMILLLIISFLIPSSRNQLDAFVHAWERVKEPFQSIRSDFENAFSALRVSTQVQPDIYDRTLNLGIGNELSEQEIFTAIAQTKIPQGVRLFWRSRVYDQYENGQWMISEYLTRDIGANAFEVELPIYKNRPSRLHSFTIYLNQPVLLLNLPSQPYWLNLPVQIEFKENPDDTIDLLAIRSPNLLTSGKSFSVRSSLSSVTVEQLQAAGEDYPPWITEKYLQLPDSITERTRNLAWEIVGDAVTPYDKVIAVTEYLRNQITYVETLDKLPGDQEVIDWFLFDYQKGFCNYSASAEVILLRSLGIPTRLAVGYAEGTMEDIQSANVYVVRQRDAHAWPEVFFPDIGWIEFEPTSSQPDLSYPEAQSTNELPRPLNEQEVNPQEILSKIQAQQEELQDLSTSAPKKSPLFSLTLLMLVFITLIVWIYLNGNQIINNTKQLPEKLENTLRDLGMPPPKILVEWNRRARLLPIEKSYQRINTALRVLGNPPLACQTPSERAIQLMEILPEVKAEIRHLIQHYQDALYGTTELPRFQKDKASARILRLAYQRRLQTDLQRLFSWKK